MLSEAVPRFSRGIAFVISSISLISVFFSAGIAIPLYNIFRVHDGITDSDLALTTVAYLGATALSLLLLGRLSNHLGRRPVVVSALAFTIMACLVLMQVHSLPVLITGRVLQGVACGLASTAAGAMVIDMAPRHQFPWLAAVITSSAPPFANPIGALFSGLLIEHGPSPRMLAFALTVGVISVLLVLVLFCPETVKRTPGAARSLVPHIQVPSGAGRTMIATGCGLVATWSFSGFYQAFAPGLTADYLGTSNAIMIAVVFGSIVVLSPVGGSLSGRLHPAFALRLGLVIFTITVIIIVWLLHLAAIVPFLLTSAFAGAAQGISNGGGMRSVMAQVPVGERAGTLATLYLVSYGGGALPGLAAGELSHFLSLPDIASCYAALVIVATVIAMITTRDYRAVNPRPVQ